MKRNLLSMLMVCLILPLSLQTRSQESNVEGLYSEIPIGGVILWWGRHKDIPESFEACDGKKPEARDAVLDVKKPDLRGRFPVGALDQYRFIPWNDNQFELTSHLHPVEDHNHGIQRSDLESNDHSHEVLAQGNHTHAYEFREGASIDWGDNALNRDPSMETLADQLMPTINWDGVVVDGAETFDTFLEKLRDNVVVDVTAASADAIVVDFDDPTSGSTEDTSGSFQTSEERVVIPASELPASTEDATDVKTEGPVFGAPGEVGDDFAAGFIQFIFIIRVK